MWKILIKDPKVMLSSFTFIMDKKQLQSTFLWPNQSNIIFIFIKYEDSHHSLLSDPNLCTVICDDCNSDDTAHKPKPLAIKRFERATFDCPPLLFINGHPCVSTLHDLRHGGEVQDGWAGQHEAVLQRGQDVLNCLTAQHPAAEFLLHKLAAQTGHRMDETQCFQTQHMARAGLFYL